VVRKERERLLAVVLGVIFGGEGGHAGEGEGGRFQKKEADGGKKKKRHPPLSGDTIPLSARGRIKSAFPLIRAQRGRSERGEGRRVGFLLTFKKNVYRSSAGCRKKEKGELCSSGIKWSNRREKGRSERSTLG